MKLTGFAIAAALGTTAIASAGTMTLTYLGYANASGAGVRYSNKLSWNSSSKGAFSTITVGSHRWSVYGQERTTFCTQLFEGVTAGNSYTYSVVDPSQVPEAEVPTNSPGPMGAIKAALVNDLYRRYYAGLNGTVDTGAFQIAIYEITHENLTALTAAEAVTQLGLDRGAFQASKASGAYATAAGMLASLGQGGFGNMGGHLFGMKNPSAQDQLLVVPIGAPAVLAGLGLLGVGFMRRRMK